MTRYEAFIDRNWRERGFHSIAVARIRSPGDAEIGLFLTDRWCLGVKDAAYLGDASEAEFNEFVQQRLPEELRERIHPAWAKKLIEGAVAYAEGLGFAPHRDYRKARRVLGGIDASLCPETFTYGHEGKPCYVAGEFDSPERVERVLAILKSRCGEDGFHYVVREAMDDDEEPGDDEAYDDEADDETRGALMDFFADAAGGEPGFFEFSGMVTALHICPQIIMPAKFLGRFWGPKGHEWASPEELEEFMTNLQFYWNNTADVLAGCLDAPPGDIWPIDVYQDEFEDTAGFARSLMAWCRGFVRATTEWPEAWGDALTRKDLAPHWALVRAWACPDTPANMELIEEVGRRESAKLRGQALPVAVVAL